jgi:hypothetical protein
MENTSSINEYVIWIIIISLTIFFFNYFIKIFPDYKKLFPSVLASVWICVTIITGCFEYFANISNDLFSLDGFTGLMAFRLPSTLIIGGITFWIKYNKFKKKKIKLRISNKKH